MKMENRLDQLLDQENPPVQRTWGGIPFSAPGRHRTKHRTVNQLPIHDAAHRMEGVVVQGEARVLSCEALPDIEVVEIEDPSSGSTVLVQV